MKVTCEIVEDLLPLYADDVCSEQSRRAVREHLQKCEKCRKLLESTQEVSVPSFEPDKPKADKAIQKGFKKIRLRHWASLALVIVISSLVFYAWNQYHTKEVVQVVDKEYQIGSKFMELLCQGNYEKAYEYIDIEEMKQEWIGVWFEEEQLVNMKEDGLAKFCEYAAKLEEMGGIEKYQYIGNRISGGEEDGTLIYEFSYKIYISGNVEMLDIYVSKEGVEHFRIGDGSFLDDPLAQFSIWSEYLWQDYQGCYYDPDLKQYVYYDKE